MDKPFCPKCNREYEPGDKFCLNDGASLIVRADDELTGQTFDGRYRIEHKLGEGGMGAVYKAVQITTGKAVAIKMVAKHLTENPNTIRRFQREVKMQSQLEHTNIVGLIDFSRTDEGQYFFVMPFVEGKSLRQTILDSGKFDLPDFFDIASQILDGLDYAHMQGVIHRDIKSDNIIVARMGRQRIVKILDFGLAKTVGDAATSKASTVLTFEGRVLGTPAYMSPEQAKGEVDKIKAQSDIYSLGVIFFEMLSGKLPFDSDTPWGLMHKHISEPPPPVTEVNPDAPPEIEKVIMRCLEKEQDNRYPTVIEIKQDLEQVSGSMNTIAGGFGAAADSAMTANGVSPPPKSKKGMVVAIAVLAILLVMAMGVMSKKRKARMQAASAPQVAAQAPTQEPEKDKAEQERLQKAEEEKQRLAKQEAERKSAEKAETLRQAELKAKQAEAAKRKAEAEKLKAEKERREKIATLLGGAEADFMANRLTGDDGENAYDKYKAVLKLDPGNGQAEKGIEAIAAKYLEWTEKAIAKKKFELAEELLKRAVSVKPGEEDIRAMGKELERSKAKARRQQTSFKNLNRDEGRKGQRDKRKKAEELGQLIKLNLAENNYDEAERLMAELEILVPSNRRIERLKAQIKERKQKWLEQKQAGEQKQQPAAQGEQIGFVASVNLQWNYVVITLIPGSKAHEGDVVEAFNDPAKRYRLKIKRITDGNASASPVSGENKPQAGTKVYAEPAAN